MFFSVAVNSQVWMSHSDSIKTPTNAVKLWNYSRCKFAYKIEGETTYAIQVCKFFTRVVQNVRNFLGEKVLGFLKLLLQTLL
jgi:GMP synthase-like glutamine amidotransferase